MQKLPTEIIQIILKIKWWNARKKFLEKNLVLPKIEKMQYEPDEDIELQEDEFYCYHTFKNNKNYYFSVYYGNLSLFRHFSCDDKKFDCTYGEVFF